MSYIGNTPSQQAFVPAIDYFSGNGSTTAFTLSRPVGAVTQVQVVIANVPQNPSTAFSVSGNTITFTSAPPSGTNNIYVYYTSPITQTASIPQAPSIIGPLSVKGSVIVTTDGATAVAQIDGNGVQSANGFTFGDGTKQVSASSVVLMYNRLFGGL